MITTEIGLNAGKIWCELCNSKEQTNLLKINSHIVYLQIHLSVNMIS